MEYNLKFNQNPTVDVLIAVAAKGGVENCVNMLGRYLKNKGFRVRIIQLIYEGESWADETLEFYYIYESRKVNALKDYIEGYEKKLLEIGAPDIVLATAWPMMSYVAKATADRIGADYMVASWLHAPLEMYIKAGYGDGEMLDKADFHFAISEEIADAIKNQNANAKIYKINNPVDTSKTRKVSEIKPGTLIFVGRLSSEKNIHIILGAIALAKTNWRLKIVGDGDEMKKLKKLAGEFKVSDKVDFLGWSDDPWSHAEGCFALAMSSFYEGFPLAAIEALSCGLPVIANKSSRVGEIVIQGETGFIYKDDDPEGLAALLDNIYAQKEKSYSVEKCIASVAKYSKDIALFDFYLKLYAALSGRLIIDRLYQKGKDTIIDDKISVIIPCYNAAKYIDRCLNSLTGQTIGIENLEIILVNDASTDNTFDILCDYESRYPDSICVINLPENCGQGRARNIGMSYATGSYITFVDADDYIGKDMLLNMFLAAACYPVDFISCDFMMFSGDAVKETESAGEDFAKLLMIENDTDRKRLFLQNAFTTAPWAKLIKRNLLTTGAGNLFPENVRMEDILFTYRLLSKVTSYISMPFCGYYYYENDSGIMRSKGLKRYYMDVLFVFRAAVNEYKDKGLFAVLYEELTFVFYKKVFINLMQYMASEFEELPLDNIRQLLDYALTEFPDYKDNKYLSDQDKNEIEDFCVEV